MSSLRYNKSKTYLLPLIAELIGMEAIFFKYLVNTYINDSEGKYENCIYILHDFSFKNPEFTAYENKITKNQYFVDLIDIDNQVLYVFKFPDEYMKEYNYFILGQYSNFGIDAKNLILSYFTRIYQNNFNAVPFLLKIKQILFKDKILKEQIEKELNVKLSDSDELTDIMLLENETFNLTIIKQE